MKPNWGHSAGSGILDCWNGYSNGGANNPSHLASADFYPLIVQIPDDVPLDSIHIQFEYAMASVTATNGLNNPPRYGDGTIRIWTRDGSFSRNGLIVTAGGDNVMSTGTSITDTYYTPEQLGFSESVRTVTLYVEAVRENAQTTRELAELLGKLPETTIKLSVTIDDVGVFTDEVRYVVANTGSFYYELMTHPELMATYASKAVYGAGTNFGPDDKPEFCLKLQTPAELEALGFDSHIISLLSTANLYGGLKAGLYREYITGKYILAFAGSEFPAISENVWNTMSWDQWADWLENNFPQAFGFGGSQYNHAMDIGAAFADPSTKLNASNTYITGHSLGGGLASASSIYSGFQAYTFNAAGLHPDTVNNHPNYANATSLITAYQVDWDILSWGQYAGNWAMHLFGVDHIPQAVGTKVPIDSEYDSTIFVNISGGALLFLIPGVGPIAGTSQILGTMLYYGTLCHMMDQVIYGMEQMIF